jgi:hypothetical protein
LLTVTHTHTHSHIHSDFGGSLNYYVSVDKYLVETYNEEWVHAQMSLYVRWANFNLGVYVYVCMCVRVIVWNE